MTGCSAAARGCALLHTPGPHEGRRGADPHRRPVALPRSGSPGRQRRGAVTRSGDVTATRATPRAQIADGLDFRTTGNLRRRCGIGGFFVDRKEQRFWRGDFPADCDDVGHRELYVRRLQFAAFMPMFRSHATQPPYSPDLSTDHISRLGNLPLAPEYIYQLNHGFLSNL
ncbi:hypothetical protein G3I71_26540 [Streptomyces sp. SID12501]|uniref:Glycoside hydrolase family 31 TIM barrel domain-containing protein n=1 Tax=Streptomyces sp. SID12501 TaxID=2706042 RepID=A0A6B3BY48_9ACTN|nr:hypothetical protein [Streptomyces sp. SID12501]